MKKFTTYLTETKNTHMEHIEDNVLNGGVQGARESIKFLRSLRDMLSGSSGSAVSPLPYGQWVTHRALPYGQGCQKGCEITMVISHPF